jgi:N-hydroxyarylamine O-acetyltransferase
LTTPMPRPSPSIWRRTTVPEGRRFADNATIRPDHELGNWYTSTNPPGPFISTLIMERVSSDKRYKLINRRFAIEARDGQVAVERSIGSAEELRQVLDESFNVTPPAPVEEIFTRIAG